MAYDYQTALYDLVRDRPGWTGAYTTQEAPGALPNGSRVIKVSEESGDATPLGTAGTVLGSMFHERLGHAYFIEWDDKPKCAVLVVPWKVEVAS